MRIGLVTREWPPDVYGGAGVHVEYLTRELRRLVEVEVHCFGEPRADAEAYAADPALAGANAALQTLSVDLRMTAGLAGCELVHSHTWYANMAGHLTKLMHGRPHVMTMHSLEPLRPWKAEQLGGGYRVSSWAERTAALSADALIAVSAGMAADVRSAYPDLDPARIQVVHNGIDANEYRPVSGRSVLTRHGIDPDVPYALFVGRITRQKGLAHLLRAAADLPGQLVVCAGAPDTPEIAAEIEGLLAELGRRRPGVVWIETMLPRPEVIELLSHATVFVCPSVYEPLGIVNLEAMACATAVVASAVGGIPEVVEDSETGLLVPYDPSDPVAFETALASSVAELLTNPARAAELGKAGRRRVVEHFGWDAIAARTVEVYRAALEG